MKIKKIRFIFFLLIGATSICSFGQNKPADIKNKKLLLNMAWTYLYVVGQNQIDRDSALVLSSRLTKIDKLILISPDDETPLYTSNIYKTGKEEIQFLKDKLPKAVGKEKIRILNAISWMYAFEHGPNTLDSTLLFIEKVKIESAKLQDDKGFNESLCYQGLYHYKKGELKEGDSCLMAAIQNFKKLGNKNGEAMALSFKGIYYPYGMGPFDVRIDCLKKALALYQQLNDKYAQAITLLNIAYLSFATNQLAASEQFTLASLQMQKEIGFAYTHYTTDLLSLVAVVQGNNADYLKYALESIRTMEATNDPVGRAYFYARVADAYSEMDNNVAESINWYFKAFNEFEKEGGDFLMYKALYNLGNQMEQIGRSKDLIPLAESLNKKYPPVNIMDRQNLFLVLARAYTNTGEFIPAGKYYEQAEKLQPEVESLSKNINTSAIYFYIGSYYFKIKQYEKSRSYFLKTLSAKPIGVGIVALKQIQLSLFSIDSAAGNLNNAIQHLKEYNTLNDSIYSEKQSKQIQEWDILFKTEKKEKDLALLTKDNQVNQLNLKKAAIVRNIIIASSILLLAILLTGYYFKQRHNTKLQVQQKEINDQNSLLKEYLTAQQKLVAEKEWLVKEIHHRVKNNLQMIISLLNAQSEFLDNPSALNAIKQSRERMQAVALIHQKLYQPNQGTSINMASYIQEMVHYAESSFADKKIINFKLDIGTILLDVSQAVPLGLILNEAITNAVKYAFPSNQNGTINIQLLKIDKEDIELKIKDNGKGMPEDFDFYTNNSLGIQLIHLFAEQLDGKLQFNNDNGVEIILNFKKFHTVNSVAAQINHV